MAGISVIALGARRRTTSRGKVRRAIAWLVVAACSVSSIQTFWPAASSAIAWFIPAGFGACAGNDAEKAEKVDEYNEGRNSLERRRLFAAASVAASVEAWQAHPDEAHAFRQDYIYNAKRRFIPKIRKFIQKLEGLRDDLYLEVDFLNGTRAKFGARPAVWYDGVDRKLIGKLILAEGVEGFGCQEYTLSEPAVVLVPRGRCSFNRKVSFAEAAGAKAVLLYDEKMGVQQSEEFQFKTGTTRSKGIQKRGPGDALTSGNYLKPIEEGMTIMAVDPNARQTFSNSTAAVMISRTNGTDIANVLRDGGSAKVLAVTRFQWEGNEGIDRFIKKDLKKMLNEMEIYDNNCRESKDDLNDPLLKSLKKDRKAFETAVLAKDYGAIKTSFDTWANDRGKFKEIASWTLEEYT